MSEYDEMREAPHTTTFKNIKIKKEPKETGFFISPLRSHIVILIKQIKFTTFVYFFYISFIEKVSKRV